MFIVQCSVAGTNCSGDRPIPSPLSWRISPPEDTIKNVVEDLLDGQYNNPVRVIGFNAAERTSRDVTSDVARELRRCCLEQNREPPEFLHDFLTPCVSERLPEPVARRR
jgi:hypothetical protein